MVFQPVIPVLAETARFHGACPRVSTGLGSQAGFRA